MSIHAFLATPTLASDLERVEEALRTSINVGNPFLEPALGHLVNAGGKRLRPTLTIVAAQAVTHDRESAASDNVIAAAASVELLHIGSLLHDDVIDEADSRRGTVSVNRRFGNPTAILAGDRLLALAAQITAKLGQFEAEVMADTLAALCDGQMLETGTMYDVERSEDAYLSSIAGKTAALLATSARLGGHEAGGTPDQIDALASYGHHLGMAFQIVDDLLDLTATDEILGKPAGKDILEGVFSIPVIKAIDADDEIRLLLDQPMTVDIAAEARLKVVASPAIRAAFEMAREQVHLACDVLTKCTALHEPTVQAFQDVARHVLEQLREPAPELLATSA